MPDIVGIVIPSVGQSNLVAGNLPGIRYVTRSHAPADIPASIVQLATTKTLCCISHILSFDRLLIRNNIIIGLFSAIPLKNNGEMFSKLETIVVRKALFCQYCLTD